MVLSGTSRALATSRTVSPARSRVSVRSAAKSRRVRRGLRSGGLSLMKSFPLYGFVRVFHGLFPAGGATRCPDLDALAVADALSPRRRTYLRTERWSR